MSKKTALVVCPGRGTYNKSELGYLMRYHSARKDMLAAFEAERARQSQTSLAELDGTKRYSVSIHTRGDNASLLIHACAFGDYQAIDRDAFEIVAVTGNSMGWYIALACAGAVSMENGARIVNTMGTIMQDNLIGGQIVYPLVDEDWKIVPGRRAAITELMAAINAKTEQQVFVSIELGGFLVLAGNAAGLKALTKALPVIDRFPMTLANHAAFHTPLQTENSKRGFAALRLDMFDQPKVAMIDGRGAIWPSGNTDTNALYQYTFGEQVESPYDFTRAVEVGVKEFAPECVIVLGPGSTLSGAVAQSLIGIQWRGVASKADFSERQMRDPYLLAMGREEQRRLVCEA